VEASVTSTPTDAFGRLAARVWRSCFSCILIPDVISALVHSATRAGHRGLAGSSARLPRPATDGAARALCRTDPGILPPGRHPDPDLRGEDGPMEQPGARPDSRPGPRGSALIRSRLRDAPLIHDPPSARFALLRPRAELQYPCSQVDSVRELRRPAGHPARRQSPCVASPMNPPTISYVRSVRRGRAKQPALSCAGSALPLVETYRPPVGIPGDVPLSGGCSPHRVGQRWGDYDAIRAGCATSSVELGRLSRAMEPSER